MVPELRSGREPFNRRGNPLGWTLLDYWRWSGSELLSNVERGVLAEFLVANVLELTEEAREEWGAFDLEKYGRAIEVKSAAYIQPWEQGDYSAIKFDIAPRKSAWNPKVGKSEPLDPPKRVAGVYVFCLLKHRCQETIDPLDVDQWEFYVVPTASLDSRYPKTESITLSSLKQLTGASVQYDQLSDALMTVIRSIAPTVLAKSCSGTRAPPES